MDNHITLFYTPGIKISGIQTPAVTQQIRKEKVVKLMWSAIEGKEEEGWVRENFLRPDQWPCVLVGWRRDHGLFRRERPPKGKTTILYPEESVGEVKRRVEEEFVSVDPHFGITRSDAGRLEIAHSSGRIHVYLRREDESCSFSLTLWWNSLKLSLLLWLENLVLPVEKHVKLSHYCDRALGPSRIRADVGEITKIIPRGVVMLAGEPCRNHLVYVCADPEPLVHLLNQPQQ